MKLHRTGFKGFIFLCICILFLPLAGISKAETGKRPGVAGISSKERSAAERFVSIDFNDVDINVFIKFISELTGKNFVVDQKVKGKVTIISPAKISIVEAYQVFESVLEVHGYATVQAGKIIKIVPSPDARTKSIETKLKEEAGSPEDKVITQLVPLKYADPNEIKRLFSPLISKSSVILAYQPTNMLIVTDVYSNILRLLRILKTIDIPGIGQEISVIPIEYGDAAQFVQLLNSVFKAKKPRKGETEKPIVLVPDERTNAVVLLSSEEDTLRVKDLIHLLDKDIPKGKGRIRVYYLEYAVAEEMAAVLQQLPTKTAGAVKGKKTAPVVSEKVKISADKATNSLIITAEKDDYLVLEEIIKKLDIPRAMVYIEALIMEVNVDKSFDLGVDWTALGTTDIDGKSGIFGGAFGNAAIGDLTTPPSSGFSLGIISEGIKFGDVTFSNIAAMVKALQTDEDVNILSTPQVLTTDNEEAKIVIAENIPFQTQSAAESATATYSSFEYRDVGKTLTITPSISKGRLVRLKISLEVSNVLDTTDNQPKTSKRTVDTTVIVKDKNTVVIGGLIDDVITVNESRVPCLGGMPVMGGLFRSTENENTKTNLYVFITPTVIKSPEEADDVYKKKKDQIEGVKSGTIKMYKPNAEEPETVSEEPLPQE
ncbi:type II secretion system secretin GspD [Thermodesulfobacteriota bacterium]